MTTCEVKENGWCERHQRCHVGHNLQLALRDDAVGEKYRLLWDRRPALPHERKCPEGLSLPPMGESFGLGDAVEKALAAVGVTKERVSTWLGAPCGCGQRQAKLNALGSWVATGTRDGWAASKSALMRILE